MSLKKTENKKAYEEMFICSLISGKSKLRIWIQINPKHDITYKGVKKEIVSLGPNEGQWFRNAQGLGGKAQGLGMPKVRESPPPY